MVENPYTLTIRDVCKIAGVGRSTIYRWVMAGHFPRFRKIGMGVNGRIRWSETDVAAWVAARVETDATA